MGVLSPRSEREIERARERACQHLPPNPALFSSTTHTGPVGLAGREEMAKTGLEITLGSAVNTTALVPSSSPLVSTWHPACGATLLGGSSLPSQTRALPFSLSPLGPPFQTSVSHCRHLGLGTSGVNLFPAAMGGGASQSEACSAPGLGRPAN